MVNKRRTRERPPTGTIDLKDIQAAQSEIRKTELTDKSADKSDLPKSDVSNYLFDIRIHLFPYLISV